jgi:hypothetical protein
MDNFFSNPAGMFWNYQTDEYRQRIENLERIANEQHAALVAQADEIVRLRRRVNKLRSRVYYYGAQ